MEKLQFFYKHSKTGNIYEYLGRVFVTNLPPKEYDRKITVHCCENKDVTVEIYEIFGKFFYVPEENPNLHENTATKVLYERDGVKWVRSNDDFYKIIELDGERVPRFKKV